MSKGQPREKPVLPTSPPTAAGEASDGALLRGLRDGDGEAAEILYYKYAHRLRAFVESRSSPALAARLDAEDILQSVFRSFFRAATVTAYDVPDGGDLWKLLLTIALNKVRAQANFHHAAKRNVDATTSLNVHATDPALASREDLSDAFLQMALDEALALLPQPQREVVELRLRGHEVDAIARQVGRSKRTVERNLQRATAKLTAHFESD